MPAESLAHHVHGAQHAVVLMANGKRAQTHCEKYAAEFVEALRDAIGDVRLVMAIRDGEYECDASDATVRIIAFDGALRPAEMTAYVAQRMVSYDGLGSTSLFRHLVTEYAGFDPSLAEKLSQMDPSQILALPESLSSILSDNLLRWSQCSWVAGTRSSASKDFHSLHEWYVATHAGNEAGKARHLSERRYWRACLKAHHPVA